MAYYTINKLKQRSSHAASDAVPSSSSPFAELEGPCKPIIPAIQVSSTHDNDLEGPTTGSNLCVHRGRPSILPGFSAFPMANVPLQTMSDGVWVCCDCGGLGNVLSPERCPLCGHGKCLYCN
ncbi:hypothetical protein N7481_013038 [Penicillium waksmanii]|uniref:uncharacterized protein n=1 Tax=Penicillium waksmanii TaxID=69791 RepID=UPI0025474FB0|nr:uncharacterized protein N7481_013038 [Penicillium waksmanii]KAJ5966324.1 hypothetical protein N7481_013038 [Penicillium waksmanii]